MRIVIMFLIPILLMGMIGSIHAQEKYILIKSDNTANYYIDITRIQLYPTSNFYSIWLKTVFSNNKVATEQEKNIDKKNYKERSKVKKDKNIAFQLLNQQFDSINFKYKILDVYSCDEHAQVLSSEKVESFWMDIRPDSVEEKVLIAMKEYIQQNPDQVTIRVW